MFQRMRPNTSRLVCSPASQSEDLLQVRLNSHLTQQKMMKLTDELGGHEQVVEVGQQITRLQERGISLYVLKNETKYMNEQFHDQFAVPHLNLKIRFNCRLNSCPTQQKMMKLTDELAVMNKQWRFANRYKMTGTWQGPLCFKE